MIDAYRLRRAQHQARMHALERAAGRAFRAVFCLLWCCPVVAVIEAFCEGQERRGLIPLLAALVLRDEWLRCVRMVLEELRDYVAYLRELAP